MVQELSDELLNERQAAAYLGHRPVTLRGWRYEGTGPEYLKTDGFHVRYPRTGLDAFKLARRSRRARPAEGK